MSRGGTEKARREQQSRRSAPSPPPKRRSRAEKPVRDRPVRERSARPRGERRARPGIATFAGSVLAGLGSFLTFAGLVLITDEAATASEISDARWALVVGLVALPVAMAIVVVLTGRVPLGRSILLAFSTLTMVGYVVFFVLAFAGVVAALTALTAAVAGGGVVAMAPPMDGVLRPRLVGVAVLVVVVFVMEIGGFLAGALLGPFIALPVIRLADNRTTLRAGQATHH